MSKEEKKTGRFKDAGTVKIADDVVAKIAALAALEVDGVTALAGGYNAQTLEKISRANLAKGSKIIFGDGDVHVELSIMLGYSYNIPATCEQVQNKVKSAIQSMTGLKVSDIDVRIAGITIPES